MKYDWKFKLDCVRKYKDGITDFVPPGQSKSSFLTHVHMWVKDFNDFGIDGLKHSPNNRTWTFEERFNLVAKVLAGNSINSVSINEHVNPGQLYFWIKKYREKGIDGLKYLKKGKRTKEEQKLNMMEKKRIKLTPSEKDELKILKERNKYLEAENLYLKKLRALELEKTAKLAKAKKQKL